MTGHRLILLFYLQPECLLGLEQEPFPKLWAGSAHREPSAGGSATFVLLGNIWNVFQVLWTTYVPVQRTVWLQSPLLSTALGEDLFVSGVLKVCPSSDPGMVPQLFLPSEPLGQ